MTVSPVDEAIARTHREEWARVVASLARRFGDLDLAEEAAADAWVAAVERWPRDGIPPNPGGWLTTTATRRAIDRLRRESRRDVKQEAAYRLVDDSPPVTTGAVEDDRLRLVFTCCHPALATEARVALTLRLIGGLTVAEIARAFLVQEATMAQRITRAKAKIKAAHIPYRVPSEGDVRERLAGVLAVVFLIFNEGYLASYGDQALRADLTDEAIRLGRLLHTLLPDDGEVTGLLALMLLTDARRSARLSPTGALVTLAEQDRGRWDRALIREGHVPRARVRRRGGLGRRSAGSLSVARRDQCRSHACALGTRDGLGAGRHGLRPAGAGGPVADRAAQPGGRRRRAVWRSPGPRRGGRGGRGSRRLPRDARDPRGPAAPARA